jgi:hypothetical protein
MLTNGFLSAGVTQAFAGRIDNMPLRSSGRIMTAATLGGTASVLGGGKFANGALTGAFSRAFNDEMEHTRRGYRKVGGALKGTAEIEGAVQSGGGIHIGLVGVSLTTSIDSNACVVTTQCSKIGLGLFQGVGAGASLSLTKTGSNILNTLGIFLETGVGPSSISYSINVNADKFNLGKGIVGPGVGFAVGMQYCEDTAKVC